MTPRLEDWTAWKRLCARQLCGTDTRQRLGNFARSRFNRQLERQLAVTNLGVEDAALQRPSADEAWHRFESYAALTQTRQGKRYKEWIFARIRPSAQSPLYIIQAGATLIMRSAVRTYLRDEYAPRRATSLDAPVGDGSLTLGDLLPGTLDPGDDLAAGERDLLAANHAAAFLTTLSRRERVGLLAKFSGIGLDNADVQVAAGCRKSVLSQAVRDLLSRLRESLLREYQDDGHDATMAFAAIVLQHLEKIIHRWKNSEKGLPRCFYNVGEDVGRGK